MTKKLVIWIAGGFVLSIGTVAFLFAMSGIMKDNRNSFLRLFPSHPVLEGNSFDLKYNSYYIAGGTSEHIYLGNYSSPLHLLVLNKDLTDTVHLRLNVNGIMDQKFWSARVRVDSPYFYVNDGAVPRIYKGPINTWTADRIGYDTEYFLDIEPTGKSTLFIKSLALSNESVLGKISLDSPHYRFTSGILTKQIDGVFCVDGYLNYSKELKKLIYVYRYRNEYIVIDTNLNVTQHGRTIDTTTHAKLKVAWIASNKSKTLAGPPLIVNKQSSSYKNWLFINSDLLAKNEHRRALKEASVIDVYDINRTNYLFSFYIFNTFKNERLREFRVIGNRVYALFETTVQVFDLNKNVFQQDRSK